MICMIHALESHCVENGLSGNKRRTKTKSVSVEIVQGEVVVVWMWVVTMKMTTNGKTGLYLGESLQNPSKDRCREQRKERSQTRLLVFWSENWVNGGSLT